jgi:hypothetical protein
MLDGLDDTEEEGLEDPFVDHVQVALLASFMMARQERNGVRAIEEEDATILSRVINIS